MVAEVQLAVVPAGTGTAVSSLGEASRDMLSVAGAGFDGDTIQDAWCETAFQHRHHRDGERR
jgi:hypothetical protein